ncbi:ATP-dependent endonuclease [Frankia sp. Cj3]|uniref:ATP-dependent nuclease n=1 Tax=Frankia sp. Cj3 TaxID=2880976 RepID=UPI001EF681E6|nr:AAA family ATPase [Frankia sp. Cj3]
MKLTRLELWNYRAFEHAVVEFPSSGLLLVVGANNSGKSALLSSLDAIAHGATSPNDRHYKATEPPRATATFELDDAEITRLLVNASDTLLHEGGQFRQAGAFREIHWEFAPLGGDRLAPVSIRAKWNGRDEVVLVQARLESNGIVMIETNGLGAVLEGKPGQDFRMVILQRLFSNDGNGFRAGYQGAFRPLYDYFVEWASGIYHFTPLRTGAPGDVYSAAAHQVLAPDGQNLPGVLYRLKLNEEDQYEKLMALIEDIVPGVGQMRVPAQGNQISITFRDRSYRSSELNLKRLGTGVEQLLMTLVVGVTEQARSMIIMEEPETNLHPGAQRALFALIKEWAAERPFIIATHSPVFLDASAGSKLLLVTRDGSTSHVRALGSESLDALKELGVRLSDVLSADRILLVEGPSDEAILRTWFPEHLRNPRLVVVDGGGGDNARHAKRLQQWIDSADRLGDRKVLYLRDRDELPAGELAALSRTGAVKVGSGREIENYLLDPEALASVLTDRSGNAVNADEVAKTLGELADDLKQAVVLKRVCRNLHLPPLIDHKLRGDLGKRRAGLDDLKTVVARLKTAESLEAELDELWPKAQKAVDADWENQRLRLAPGEEVLNGLWGRYGLGGYSKKADGPAIAARMMAPPLELAADLKEFLTG